MSQGPAAAGVASCAASGAPAADPDGVRLVRTPQDLRRTLRRALPYVVLAALAAGAWVGLQPDPSAPRPPPAAGRAPQAAARSSEASASLAARATTAPTAPSGTNAPAAAPDIGPDDLPGHDPDDMATYVSRDDPEPTMREVIQALHDVGDHTGLGAFNPPGTSPPLRGLAVPPDFVLPPGYVRHHQVTDEGEPLEPILMFSPDASPRDADGNELALPEDLVVPPHLAPPGLPLREIDIPPRP